MVRARQPGVSEIAFSKGIPVGALSDRTRGRLGRRAPWMLSGAFLGGIMLMLFPLLGTQVWILAIMWILTQMALNSLQKRVDRRTIEQEIQPEGRV